MVLAGSITAAQFRQVAIVSAGQRFAIGEILVLPIVVGVEDVGVVSHGAGITQEIHRVGIQRGLMLHPDPHRAQLARHFCHDRSAAAMPDQMERQFRQAPAAQGRNQVRGQQRLGRLGRNLRAGGSAVRGKRGPVQGDDDFARVRRERIPTAEQGHGGIEEIAAAGNGKRVAGVVRAREIAPQGDPIAHGNHPVGHVASISVRDERDPRPPGGAADQHAAPQQGESSPTEDALAAKHHCF